MYDPYLSNSSAPAKIKALHAAKQKTWRARLRDGLAGRFATGFGAAPRFLVRGLVCDQAPNPHAQRHLAH
jgi:hypothetical protein